jgi:hypothetical protein
MSLTNVSLQFANVDKLEDAATSKQIKISVFANDSTMNLTPLHDMFSAYDIYKRIPVIIISFINKYTNDNFKINGGFESLIYKNYNLHNDEKYNVVKVTFNFTLGSQVLSFYTKIYYSDNYKQLQTILNKLNDILQKTVIDSQTMNDIEATAELEASQWNNDSNDIDEVKNDKYLD